MLCFAEDRICQILESEGWRGTEREWVLSGGHPAAKGPRGPWSVGAAVFGCDDTCRPAPSQDARSNDTAIQLRRAMRPIGPRKNRRRANLNGARALMSQFTREVYFRIFSRVLLLSLFFFLSFFFVFFIEFGCTECNFECVIYSSFYIFVKKKKKYNKQDNLRSCYWIKNFIKVFDKEIFQRITIK